MRQPDLFRMPKKPWNAGCVIEPKAPLKPKHTWAIRQQLKVTWRRRDLAMFNCAIAAKLRACDLVRRSQAWRGPRPNQRPQKMHQRTNWMS